MEILHDGARAYTTGAYLKYNAKRNVFEVIGVDTAEEIYYDGKIVLTDENDKPYVENDAA